MVIFSVECKTLRKYWNVHGLRREKEKKDKWKKMLERKLLA